MAISLSSVQLSTSAHFSTIRLASSHFSGNAVAPHEVSQYTVLDNWQHPAHASFLERKSEFIGDIACIASQEELATFIQYVREQHPKARHVAFAALLTGEGSNTSNGSASLTERMSDDGEPSGTAGKPILEVLRKRSLVNVAVCVTRYFGGILLGAGGLIRAYAKAAALAADQAQIVPLVAYQRYLVQASYHDASGVQQLVSAYSGDIEQVDYAEQVTFTVAVPQVRAAAFEQRFAEQFHMLTLDALGARTMPASR